MFTHDVLLKNTSSPQIFLFPFSSPSFLPPSSSSLAGSKGRHGLGKEDDMEGMRHQWGEGVLQCYSNVGGTVAMNYCSKLGFPLLLLLMVDFLMGHGPLWLFPPLWPVTTSHLWAKYQWA